MILFIIRLRLSVTLFIIRIYLDDLDFFLLLLVLHLYVVLFMMELEIFLGRNLASIIFCRNRVITGLLIFISFLFYYEGAMKRYFIKFWVDFYVYILKF